MENNNVIENSSPEKNASIFTGEEFMTPREYTSIRHARNVMFFAAGTLVLNIIIMALQSGDAEYLWIDLTVWAVFVAGFTALGFYTKKKPYTAIILAIIVYAVFVLLNAALDITTLYKGLIAKIIIIFYLIKGINDAKEIQDHDKLFNKELFDNRP